MSEFQYVALPLLGLSCGVIVMIFPLCDKIAENVRIRFESEALKARVSNFAKEFRELSDRAAQNIVALREDNRRLQAAHADLLAAEKAMAYKRGFDAAMQYRERRDA